MIKSLPLCLISALLLAGCGDGGSASGGAGGSGGTGSTPTTPAEGTLLQNPIQLLSTLTAPTLLLQLNLATNQQLLSLSGTPVCDVLIYKIQYETVGGANEATTASAALMVPTGLGSACTGPRSIVLYAHGTTTERSFDMTDLSNDEALAMAAVFASQGYIVVAPNYAGYDLDPSLSSLSDCRAAVARHDRCPDCRPYGTAAGLGDAHQG